MIDSIVEKKIREEIAAYDATLIVVWIGRLSDERPVEAIVRDKWGEYLWPWYKDQRRPVPPELAKKIAMESPSPHAGSSDASSSEPGRVNQKSLF